MASGRPNALARALPLPYGRAAVLDRHALDAAGQVDRPGHRARIGRVDALDRRQFGRGEVLVPAELLQHGVGELRIAVLDLGVLGVVAVAEQADLAGRAVRQLLLALQAEAGPERAAALLDREVGVVEQRRAGMLELRRAPARPRQAVVVALVRAGRGLLGEHVEVFLVRHVRLQPLRRLAAVAGREAAAVDLAEQVFRRPAGCSRP